MPCFFNTKAVQCNYHWTDFIIIFLPFPVLDSAVKFTDELRPVRIPSIPIVDPDAFAGSSVSIMGWGDGSRKSLESDEIQVYKQR